MSNFRPTKASNSFKFFSPKSCKSSSGKFRTFASESSDTSDNEEVRNAFSTFNLDLQQILNEVNLLKNENSGLRDQLKQANQEKLNLTQQFDSNKESLENQINDLKLALSKEEQMKKKAVHEAQIIRNEMEIKVRDVLNEKTYVEKGYKKTIEKSREMFKKKIEEKDQKINKLLGALNSVKKIESQVKSMLSDKESFAAAQSTGNLANPATYKHSKSRSYIPY